MVHDCCSWQTLETNPLCGEGEGRVRPHEGAGTRAEGEARESNEHGNRFGDSNKKIKKC